MKQNFIFYLLILSFALPATMIGGKKGRKTREKQKMRLNIEIEKNLYLCRKYSKTHTNSKAADFIIT